MPSLSLIPLLAVDSLNYRAIGTLRQPWRAAILIFALCRKARTRKGKQCMRVCGSPAQGRLIPLSRFRRQTNGSNKHARLHYLAATSISAVMLG